MASLVAGTRTPIWTAPARASICQAADRSDAGSGSNLHPTARPFRGGSCVKSTRHDGSRSTRDLFDRREVLIGGAASLLISFGAGVGAARAAEGTIEDAATTSPLIQKLLETSKANKAANDAARLDDYNRRNFKEYFEFVVGSARNKKELTPAEKAIVEWLEKNK